MKKVKLKNILILIFFIILSFLTYFNKSKLKNIPNRNKNLKLSGDEIIEIPDPRLKNELLEMLKDKSYRNRTLWQNKETQAIFSDPNYVKDAKEMEITKKEAELFKTLQLYRRDIFDIRGLEHFSNLEKVDLGDNEIKDISALKNLTKLKKVDLESNPIDDMSPISELVNLESIYTSYQNPTDTSVFKKMLIIFNLK